MKILTSVAVAVAIWAGSATPAVAKEAVCKCFCTKNACYCQDCKEL